ncbi:DUF6230 family protein [Streptacidiphilus monticola]
MSQTYGKTSWKRFAVVMVPTVAATAAVGISMAQGALAASFAVSGVHATISAKDLTGSGFNQYGSVDGVMDPTTGKPVNTPVAVSGFTTAHITNLCQSVVVPLPFTLPGGEKSVTMTITGGDNGKTVDASNIILDMDDLKADSATFGNIQIGRAAGTIDQGPVDPAAKALRASGRPSRSRHRRLPCTTCCSRPTRPRRTPSR